MMAREDPGLARSGLALAGLAQDWRAWAILVLLCLALYLPGQASVPPLDRDESRFVQATRQMLETGDYVRIRFQDEARNKKPVGIHWLQAAVVSLASDAQATRLWPYRLPSLTGALLAVVLTFALGARFVEGGRAAAFPAALLLAGSLVLVVEAHLAKTDAVLLATVVAAQGALGAVYRARAENRPVGVGLALAFWIAQGIGMLIKGPITPLISLLTVVSLVVMDRRWRWLGALRPAWGAPLALAFIVPWLVAIQVATGGAFLGEAVGHDMLGKVAGGQESHGAWPGYYVLLVWVTFWPACLLLIPALRHAWRDRFDTDVRFLLAWAVPTWLLFEIVPTKLPHYVLPVYPALALLIGRMIAPSMLRSMAPWTWPARIGVGVWTLVSLVIAGGLVALPVIFGPPGWPSPTGLVAIDVVALGIVFVPGLPPPAGLVAIAVVALAIVFVGGPLAVSVWRGHSVRPVRLAALALLVFVPTFAVILELPDRLWLSRSAADAVARTLPARALPIASVGYTEPSLVFLLGTATKFASADQAVDDLQQARVAGALVSNRDEAAFQQSASARGLVPRVLDRVEGVNYSNGRRLVLTLYGSAP